MHEHHMMTHSMSFDWVSVALSLLFLGGSFFYLFRLVSPGYLRKMNGYYDGENEFWHGACLLGMVACLTPTWLPVPAVVWLLLFAVGTVWYLVRALTYGRRLAYNKQWYDFAHAAMLFGMWWMFAQPIQHWLVNLAFGAYWLWFGSYYVYRLSLDFKKPSWLSFGQDGAHFMMALVMLIMTLWPAAFSGHSHHHMQAQPGEIDSVIDSTLCGPAAAVAVIGDADFDAKVVKQSGTVVVLVSGGCVNCATEIPVYEGLAASFSKQATFVRLQKDKAPTACTWMGAKDCPAVVIVRNGVVVDRLNGFAEHDAMESFLRKHLGN
jgi:thiol-disulfide isomerase/thioredoxin